MSGLFTRANKLRERFSQDDDLGFDLSPLEEEFLVQQFLKRRGIGS